MKLKRLLLLMLLVAGLTPPTEMLAQGVKRQSIGSYGTNAIHSGAIVGQTIGQPFSTLSYSDNEVVLNPGFQQPVSFKTQRVANPETEFLELTNFPNPAKEDFQIESSETLDQVNLQVFDIRGEVVMNKEIQEFKHYSIKCSDWLPGIYFLNMRNAAGQTILNTKLIISK